MALDDLPLLRGQRPGFEQDCVGDRHLADVVQQRAPVHVEQVGLRDIEGPCQPDGQVSDPLRMPFGLLVAEVERSDPSLQGVVVGRL